MNLDFVGHLSRSAARALCGLIDGKLEDRALIVVTLADTPLVREGGKHMGYSGTLAAELLRMVEEAAHGNSPGDKVTLLGDLPDATGADAQRQTLMISVFLKFQTNRVVVLD